MVTEERPEGQEEENIASNPTGTQELAPVEVKDPVAPKGLDEHETEELKTRALALVQELGEASGSRELELSDSVTNLGIQAQRGAGTEMELLRARVGDMMTQEGPGGEIANDLADLRISLNQINPHELREASGMRKFLGWVPFVNKFTPAVKVSGKDRHPV